MRHQHETIPTAPSGLTRRALGGRNFMALANVAGAFSCAMQEKTIMLTVPRRLITLLIFSAICAVLIVPAAGCSGPDGYKTFVAAADVAANETIGPRYAAYVSNDLSLSIEQKTTYLNELQAFRATVAEAKRDQLPAASP